MRWEWAMFNFILVFEASVTSVVRWELAVTDVTCIFHTVFAMYISYCVWLQWGSNHKGQRSAATQFAPTRVQWEGWSCSNKWAKRFKSEYCSWLIPIKKISGAFEEIRLLIWSQEMAHFYGLFESMYEANDVQPWPVNMNYNDEQHRFGQVARQWNLVKPRGEKWNHLHLLPQ